MEPDVDQPVGLETRFRVDARVGDLEQLLRFEIKNVPSNRENGRLTFFA